MKNKFFLLCFLLVNNIFALDYKVTANTQLYTSDSLRLNYYSDINKNEIVSLRDTTISYSSRTGWRYSVKITYDYMPLYTNAEMLVPEKTKDLFDNEILTSFQDSQGKEWVSNNYFKLLKDRDRTLITKLQPSGYERYQKEKTEFDSSYLENFEELSSSYFFNSLIHFYDFFNFCSFYIENIEREDSFYKVKAQVCDWYIEDFKYKYTTGDFINLKISIDGDYLLIYLDDEILATYVLVDSNTLTELEAFMKTEKCNYSKVTWPRHADGTCDYEDVSSVKTVSSPTQKATAPVFILNKYLTLKDEDWNENEFFKGDKFLFDYTKKGFGVDLDNPLSIEIYFKDTNGTSYTSNINDVYLEDYDFKISENVSKDYWIPSYYYDLLKSNTPLDDVLKYEKYWATKIIQSRYNEDVTWKDEFSILKYYFDDFYFVVFGNNGYYDVDFFAYMEEVSDTRIVYNVQKMYSHFFDYKDQLRPYPNHPAFLPLYEKETPYKIILIIDGDYMKMYIDEVSEENLFQTLIRTTPEACNQIENWIKGKSNKVGVLGNPFNYNSKRKENDPKTKEEIQKWDSTH